MVTRSVTCCCPTCMKMDRSGYYLSPQEKAMTRDAMRLLPDTEERHYAALSRAEERVMVENALREARNNGLLASSR